VLLSADPPTEILARSGLIPSASAAVTSGTRVRCYLTIARAPAAAAAAAAITTTTTATATASAGEPAATASPLLGAVVLRGGGLKGADAAGLRRPPRAEEEVRMASNPYSNPNPSPSPSPSPSPNPNPNAVGGGGGPYGIVPLSYLSPTHLTYSLGCLLR
jgi:hypothetical protein